MLEISGIGVVTAFLAGLVSFLSPCVLPLVPGYLSYVAGRSLDDLAGERPAAARLPAVGLSGCFVLGFSTVFLALGASATALGQLLLAYRYELNVVGGGIVIAFGLVTIGVFRPSWLQRDLRLGADLRGGRPVAAYVLGLAFGFAWTPCIGPVLGAILTVSAATATVAEGVSLLAIYSLGLGVPFLMAAAFLGGFLGRLRSIRSIGRPLQLGAGAVMVLMGVAMLTGRLADISYWLLEALPVLSRIG